MTCSLRQGQSHDLGLRCFQVYLGRSNSEALHPTPLQTAKNSYGALETRGNLYTYRCYVGEDEGQEKPDQKYGGYGGWRRLFRRCPRKCTAAWDKVKWTNRDLVQLGSWLHFTSRNHKPSHFDCYRRNPPTSVAPDSGSQGVGENFAIMMRCHSFLPRMHTTKSVLATPPALIVENFAIELKDCLTQLISTNLFFATTRK